MSHFSKALLLSMLLFTEEVCHAQPVNILGQNISNNPHSTLAAPLLLIIPPDARANGMGDAGAASSPDANSVYWNPSKLAFAKDTLIGISISYIPWLRQLVPDLNMAYMPVYYKPDTLQTLSGSLKYFSLGNIQYISKGGITIGNYNPNEYALDISYSRRLSHLWSVAITGRYIYSNITGATSFSGAALHPGRSVAADISACYQSYPFTLFGKSSVFSAGGDISNIGPKIKYSDTNTYFLPTNLRIGIAYTVTFDEFNKLCLLCDVNRLLVPLPNADFFSTTGAKEITYSCGLEYCYRNQFSARSGLFYENSIAGGRQYVTVGGGFRLNVLTIDASYLIPLSQQSPLLNTLCISLSWYFNKHSRKPATEDNIQKQKQQL